VSRPRWAELGAIVVAAGGGERFGAPDKALAQLGGRPLLEHALRLCAAERDLAAVVVVLGAHTLAAGSALVAQLGLRDVTVCAGGATRAASVQAGLRSLDPEIELVAVHDAVRPLASAALLARVVAAARAHGAALPALPVADTLALVDDAGLLSATLDRARVRSAQTPQVARRDWLEAALAAYGATATDEGSALLAAGFPVATVPGERANLKITWPDDLALAEALYAAARVPAR
jgi:2-C-methyl-D-erythritol 4-phosphate cytidylyltransferase